MREDEGMWVEKGRMYKRVKSKKVDVFLSIKDKAGGKRKESKKLRNKQRRKRKR